MPDAFSFDLRVIDVDGRFIVDPNIFVRVTNEVRTVTVQVAFDAGSVSRLDVVSAQSQLASDTTVLPSLRQQLAQARHALALNLGTVPTDPSLPGILASVTGGLLAVTRIVKIVGFVASDPSFTGQPLVVNGASELMLEVFGDAGRHARSAVGVAVLPLDAPVEIELIAEVRD